MRLLLADDDHLMRHLFARVMDGFTEKIVETSNLAETMEMCEKEPFDIILLDLVLTDAEKEKTLAKIPEMKRKSGAAVVVVTGVIEPTIQDDAIRAGADFVVKKGMEFDSLRKALLLAVHSAVLKNPRTDRGSSYLAHVELLERLVHAA